MYKFLMLVKKLIKSKWSMFKETLILIFLQIKMLEVGRKRKENLVSLMKFMEIFVFKLKGGYYFQKMIDFIQINGFERNKLQCWTLNGYQKSHKNILSFIIKKQKMDKIWWNLMKIQSNGRYFIEEINFHWLLIDGNDKMLKKMKR